MSGIVYKFPLDLFGTSQDNRVVNEPHTIGAVKGRIFAPNYGPFFGSSVELIEASTGRNLLPVDDYILLHYYREASDVSTQAVYAAVKIVNPDISTEILFTGQHIGGEFSYSTAAIKEAIQQLELDDRPVSWGEVIGLPAEFPGAPHLHDAYDLYGFKYSVGATMEVAQAIRESYFAQHQMMVDVIRNQEQLYTTLVSGMSTAFKNAADELAAIQ